MTVVDDWLLSVLFLLVLSASTAVLPKQYFSTFGSVLQYFQGSTGMTKDSLFQQLILRKYLKLVAFCKQPLNGAGKGIFKVFF